MAKTVGQFIQNEAGVETPHPTDALVTAEHRVGIEVEIEGLRIIPDHTTYWNVITDGSLRGDNAREFVLKSPLRGGDLVRAIQELDGILNQKGQRKSKSFRCSTHVHLDVRDMEAAQVNKLTTLYCVLEPLLFEYAGNDRKMNLYCNSLVESSGDRSRYTQFSNTSVQGLQATANSWCKYSAYNLAPCMGIGSVEFRHMPALTTELELLEWVNIILSLKVWVLNNELEVELLPGAMSSMGSHGFVEDVLGPLAAPVLERCQNINIPYAMYRSVRAAQDLILLAGLRSIRHDIASEVLGEELALSDTYKEHMRRTYKGVDDTEELFDKYTIKTIEVLQHPASRTTWLTK